MNASKFIFTHLIAGLFLMPTTVCQAQEQDDVVLSQKRQITLEDKLKEARDEQKPVTVLFGEKDNPDLRYLYERLSDENRNSDDKSIILVIDPSLVPKDSPLAPYIKENIGSSKDLHTTVLPVISDPKTGDPKFDTATYSSKGYQFNIPDKVSDAVGKAKLRMAQPKKPIQGSTTGSNTTQVSGKPNTGTNNPVVPKVTPSTAKDLKHINTQNATIKEAREELLEAAKKQGLDLDRIKVRMTEFEAEAKRYSLDNKQVISTYESITDTIEGQNGPYFDSKTKDALCELVLHNVARVRAICQGNHPTCNVTTLEVYMAARHPEIYADIVRQVVQTGSYVTIYGEKITPPKSAYMPGLDETSYDIDLSPFANKRNHASQLVEMTLVNGVYETGRYHETKDSQGNAVDRSGRRYILGPPKKTWFSIGGGQWAYTTDEDQLIEKNGTQVKGRNGKGITSPELIGDDILAASEMVLGYKMPYLEAPYQITGQPWVYDLPTSKRLLEFKNKGELPLGVHTMGGMHVQTIHDIVVKPDGTCWVLLDNQKQEDGDGWVKLNTLHQTQKNMNYHVTPKKTLP